MRKKSYKKRIALFGLIAIVIVALVLILYGQNFGFYTLNNYPVNLPYTNPATAIFSLIPTNPSPAAISSLSIGYYPAEHAIASHAIYPSKCDSGKVPNGASGLNYPWGYLVIWDSKTGLGPSVPIILDVYVNGKFHSSKQILKPQDKVAFQIDYPVPTGMVSKNDPYIVTFRLKDPSGYYNVPEDLKVGIDEAWKRQYPSTFTYVKFGLDQDSLPVSNPYQLSDNKYLVKYVGTVFGTYYGNCWYEWDRDYMSKRVAQWPFGLRVWPDGYDISYNAVEYPWNQLVSVNDYISTTYENK